MTKSSTVRDTVVIDRCSKQLESLPDNQQKAVLSFLVTKYGVTKPTVSDL